jgi:tetratricopeptide (TPR) repeat protein
MILRTLLVLALFSSSGFCQAPDLAQARKLYESRKYDDAITILKSLHDDNKDYAEARYYLGRIAFDAKEYDNAASYFEEATKVNDKVADYFTWLGNSYGSEAQRSNMFKQGMLAPKMKSAWEQAVKLDAKNLDARISLIQYYLQAPGFMGGSVDKAKETAKEIAGINEAQGHLQMGNIYVSEKKIPEAEKEFLEMIKLDPSFIFRLLNFYASQKQFDKAFAMVDEALQKNSQDMTYLYQFGKLSAMSGQKLEQGQEALKKYLTYTPKPNEPSHAGANMRLAQIEEKKGNNPEAKKFFELALKIDPTLQEAKDGLQRTSK